MITMTSKAGVPYQRTGSDGPVVIALHGLGGSGDQPIGLMGATALTALDIVSPDLRGHGSNQQSTEPSELTFNQLATDVATLVDDLGLSVPPVIVGISMGAAVAVECLSRQMPVQGLVLIRPAWQWSPHPSNLRVLEEVARLLDDHPPSQARTLFTETEVFAEVLEGSRAAATALLDQFDQPDARERRNRLKLLPADAPRRPHHCDGGLVLASESDPVHPLPLATAIARDLDATLERVPPRYDDPVAHSAAVTRHLMDYVHGVGDRRQDDG